jgi:hypothetical protein
MFCFYVTAGQLYSKLKTSLSYENIFIFLDDANVSKQADEMLSNLSHSGVPHQKIWEKELQSLQ